MNWAADQAMLWAVDLIKITWLFKHLGKTAPQDCDHLRTISFFFFY